jgi:hypothetical protein
VARGDYITLFHDDDLMIADNLELKVSALDKKKNVGLVHSNFHIIDEDGKIRRENAHFLDLEDIEEAGLVFLKNSLLGYNRVNPPSAMIRKECFLKLGGFDNGVHYTTDYEYWMRIAMHYDVQYLGKALIKYRMCHHSEWTSSKYLTATSDGLCTNMLGLREEYCARKMILCQTGNVLEDWSSINRRVRKGLSESIKRLVENEYIEKGEKEKGIKEVVRICKEFPELIFEKNIAKIIVKGILGPKFTEFMCRNKNH